MEKKQAQISLPIAIIIAGALIAGAIVLTKKTPTPTAQTKTPIEQALASAAKAGVKERDIRSCIDNGEMKDRVRRDADNATALGVAGTPYNVVIGPNNQRFAIPGAFPVEFFDAVIAIMESGKARGTESFAADDLEGIYNYVMEKNTLPTIKGDTILAQVLPVDATDHIRGDRNAEIMIIEYSDFECPFCQMHHETMKKLLEKHDNVAWAYRHLPLGIHAGAQLKAEASECVAKIKGDEGFWKYADADFAALGQK